MDPQSENKINSNVPAQIRKLAFAPEIYKQTEVIAKKFGLHIDQLGDMEAELKDIFLGTKKSAQFRDDIIERLEIKRELADDITREVNEKIFMVLKDKLQAESEPGNLVSSVEKAGGFSVEPSLASSSADGDQSEKGMSGGEVSENDKDDILSGIEDPEPNVPRMEENHSEPLVDHLLGTANTQSEQKIEHKTQEPPANLPGIEEASQAKKAAAPTPKPAFKPSAPKGPDPYREIV